MEYTILGQTEIEVSRLALGTWQVAGWNCSDESRFVENIKAALDFGITLFDTAESYGNGKAEQLTAKAIGRDLRKSIVLATKFSHKNAKPEKLRLSLEASLRRLNTDYIDLYQYHWPARGLDSKIVIEQLFKFKQEGKIRAIGVSNWMEPEWDELESVDGIDSLQPCYSLLWRSVETNILKLCKSKQIAVFPYSPLCQGLLTGRFKDLESLPVDVRKSNAWFSPQKFDLVLKVIEAVEELGRIYNKTAAQVALRWLLDNSVVTAPIFGASSTQQIKENVGALGWTLSDEHRSYLDSVSSPLSADLKPHDTLFGWHPRGI